MKKINNKLLNIHIAIIFTWVIISIAYVMKGKSQSGNPNTEDFKTPRKETLNHAWEIMKKTEKEEKNEFRTF